MIYLKIIDLFIYLKGHLTPKSRQHLAMPLNMIIVIIKIKFKLHVKTPLKHHQALVNKMALSTINDSLFYINITLLLGITPLTSLWILYRYVMYVHCTDSS